MTMIIVRCPKCKNVMKYQPMKYTGNVLTAKKKRCVYCGHTFKIHSDEKKSRIIKIE